MTIPVYRTDSSNVTSLRFEIKYWLSHFLFFNAIFSKEFNFSLWNKIVQESFGNLIINLQTSNCKKSWLLVSTDFNYLQNHT